MYCVYTPPGWQQLCGVGPKDRLVPSTQVAPTPSLLCSMSTISALAVLLFPHPSGIRVAGALSSVFLLPLHPFFVFPCSPSPAIGKAPHVSPLSVQFPQPWRRRCSSPCMGPYRAWVVASGARMDPHKSNMHQQKHPFYQRNQLPSPCMLQLWTVVYQQANLVSLFHTKKTQDGLPRGFLFSTAFHTFSPPLRLSWGG